MSTRPPDYAYEALAEATATDMNTGRGELNAALRAIKEQSPDVENGLLADEVRYRARLYRQTMPNVLLTPSALAKHWLRVAEEANRSLATNQAVNVSCRTCHGDRFVHYSTRVDDGVEEYAPCPDCNHTDVSFRRYDGTRFVPPDPGKVRARVSQG